MCKEVGQTASYVFGRGSQSGSHENIGRSVAAHELLIDIGGTCISILARTSVIAFETRLGTVLRAVALNLCIRSERAVDEIHSGYRTGRVRTVRNLTDYMSHYGIVSRCAGVDLGKHSLVRNIAYKVALVAAVFKCNSGIVLRIAGLPYQTAAEDVIASVELLGRDIGIVGAVFHNAGRAVTVKERHQKTGSTRFTDYVASDGDVFDRQTSVGISRRLDGESAGVSCRMKVDVEDNVLEIGIIVTDGIEQTSKVAALFHLYGVTLTVKVTEKRFGAGDIDANAARTVDGVR